MWGIYRRHRWLLVAIQGYQSRRYYILSLPTSSLRWALKPFSSRFLQCIQGKVLWPLHRPQQQPRERRREVCAWCSRHRCLLSVFTELVAGLDCRFNVDGPVRDNVVERELRKAASVPIVSMCDLPNSSQEWYIMVLLWWPGRWKDLSRKGLTLIGYLE